MPSLSKSQWKLIATALVVAVACVVIGFNVDPQGFRSNALAELSGICLGIVIATLFIERIAKRVESAEITAERIQLHDAVSCLLGFLLESTEGNPFHWSKHPQYSQPLGARVTALRAIKDALAAGTFRMRTLQEKCVIESAHEAAASVRALCGVAFQLSGRQGLLWLSVSNSVSQLATLYPFQAGDRGNEPRTIIFGQDTFSLNFCELIDHMLEFEACKQVPITA